MAMAEGIAAADSRQNLPAESPEALLDLTLDLMDRFWVSLDRLTGDRHRDPEVQCLAIEDCADMARDLVRLCGIGASAYTDAEIDQMAHLCAFLAWRRYRHWCQLDTTAALVAALVASDDEAAPPLWRPTPSVAPRASLRRLVAHTSPSPPVALHLGSHREWAAA
jgi:hypothetical protein